MIDSTAARSTIPQLVQQFQWLLEDNAMALAEIKALWQEETIQQLKSIVASALEDADPDSIVNWMLEISADPYESYLEWQSAKRNLDLSKKMFTKNEDRYQNDLQEFLNDNTIKTNLWEYHFELDALHHDTPISSSYEVDVHHTNVMKPQIIVSATNQKQRVEDDVVWLDSFAQDIEPNYFKLDAHQLTIDLANEYNQHVQDDYIPFHHKPLTTNISWLLWW